MKPSRYNVYFGRGTQSYVYNTLTSAIVRLESGSEIQVDDPTLKSLGIAVDDDDDEYSKFVYYFERTRFLVKNRVLSVVYVPTYACNLCCSYCYENAGRASARPSVARQGADPVAAFLRGAMGADEVQEVELSLYGGEPLLHAEECIRLFDVVRVAAQGCGKRFSSRILTNGTLMTDAVIEKLIVPNRMVVQLTFDGLDRTHDAKRIRHDGTGTFGETLALVEKFSRQGLSDLLTVRINVDRGNVSELDGLCGLLEGKAARVYVSPLESIGRYQNCGDSCFRLGEYKSRQYYQLGKVLERHGFPLVFRPFGKRRPCTFFSSNKFVFDAEGDAYRCFAVAGMREHSVGRLTIGGTFEPNANYYRQTMHLPFLHGKCQDCNLLPICAGGCPKRRFFEHGSLEGYACELTEEELKTMLVEYVRRMEDDDVRA